MRASNRKNETRGPYTGPMPPLYRLVRWLQRRARLCAQCRQQPRIQIGTERRYCSDVCQQSALEFWVHG